MRPFSEPLLAELEALYRARFGDFVRVAHAIVGDRERAFDAVQDAFAGAIHARDGFRREAPLEAWVWRAVVNAARKAARRPLVEVGPALTEPVELPPALPELAPFVSALPERQRLAVFLRYYADLDYRTIGAALGIETGTVSATLAAAHASIRRALKEVHHA
jgi:DNA-directed RNA polymerase specialized sigma24 family protein